MRRLLLSLLFSLVASGCAFADGEVQKLMTQSDKTRLGTYGDVRAKALESAKSGDAADRKVLETVLSRPIVAFSDRSLTGNWQCRTIKLGGDFGTLTIYDWFKCKVTDDGSGWVLEKLTGSQRTRGRLYDDGPKRAIYLGSFFVEGDPVKPYGSGRKTDQVGYAFRTGRNAWRIEFPAPYYESTLDILELKR